MDREIVEDESFLYPPRTANVQALVIHSLAPDNGPDTIHAKHVLIRLSQTPHIAGNTDTVPLPRCRDPARGDGALASINLSVSNPLNV